MKRTLHFYLLLAGLLLASNEAFAQTWEERIVNGDFEGSDPSGFAINVRDEGSRNLESSDIVIDDDDATNHCARISFTANPWITEFVIKLTEPLSEGDMIQFSMRAKTSSSNDASLASDELGRLTVKGGGEWNTCTYSGTVDVQQNGCQTITLRFNRTSSKSDIFHFDNISLKVLKDAPIEFADAKVKETCVALWDTNRDGELSLYEAAAVKEIYSSLFLGRKDITSFDELQYFVGLESIHSFAHCSNLTSVVLPNSVKTIESEAFSGCTSLASIVIPNSVEFIRSGAFQNCSSIASIELPNSLVELYNGPFSGCSSLTSLIIPKSVKRININPVAGCSSLTSLTVEEGNTRFDSRENCNAIIETNSNTLIAGCKNTVIPNSVTSIGSGAFAGSDFTTMTIPSSIKMIDHSAFFNCRALSSVVSQIEEPFEIADDVFELDDMYSYDNDFTSATLYVPEGCKSRYESTAGWKRFSKIFENDYRPFIEEGKVWALWVYTDGYGIVTDDTWTEHYYFDGDTIIGGQTCKRMFYITNANEENWVNGVFTPASHTQHYLGNWYEQDKKVYFADSYQQQFELIYDFSISTGDSIQNIGAEDMYWQVTKVSGGIPGFFKGTYYNLSLDGRTERWLEGVGNESWLHIYQPWDLCGPTARLLSCRVGSDVIYSNSAVDDPYVMGARKGRFDFTHTIKTQPKMPRKNGIGDEGLEQSLYGEYSDLQLGIHLDPLDDAYQISITDESGKVVYGKAVNAGTIMGLNIDISAYAEGRYTVTIENSRESFTGEFENETTGISDATRLNDKGKMINDKPIYNLQGQRISSLQKGLNIVNGRKVYVR